jgi:hypothetical protein
MAQDQPPEAARPTGRRNPKHELLARRRAGSWLNKRLNERARETAKDVEWRQLTW